MKPKVNFEVARVEDYFNVLKRFALKGNMFSDSFYSEYPGLKEKLDGSENKEKALFDFFKSKEKKLWDVMNSSKEDFEREWKKYEKEIMKALEEIHETEWDRQFNKFKARITLNPVCPRDLVHKTFDLHYRKNIQSAIGIVLHEISHFMFFQKLEEIYPGIDERKFEAPHFIWKFSEMVPNVILGDKRIQDIFEHEPTVYDQIQNTSIQGKKILNYLHDFYNNRKDFADFVKKSLNFLENNREELEKQF